jgi:hypothetical protein
VAVTAAETAVTAAETTSLSHFLKVFFLILQNKISKSFFYFLKTQNEKIYIYIYAETVSVAIC